MTAKPKIAVVVGGNRGIGLSCLTGLQASGYQLVGTYRSSHPDLDGVNWVPCDVSSSGSVDAAFDQIESEIGKVSVVVSNAGVTNDTLLLQMTDDDFMSVINTNLAGAFRVARRSAPVMAKEGWGRIILIGSYSGLAGQPGQANYAASKSGLVGLARSVAQQYGAQGVTCNVVAPGPIRTEALSAMTDDMMKSVQAVSPIPRVGEPDEVSGAVCWLASESAAYTTGAVLPVDGGLFFAM